MNGTVVVTVVAAVGAGSLCGMFTVVDGGW